MKIRSVIMMIAGLALMAQLVSADWGLYVWSPNGSSNGGPGYVLAQQVSSMYGGWRGYSQGGVMIDSFLDHTGQVGGPYNYPGCEPGSWPPCRLEEGPTGGTPDLSNTELNSDPIQALAWVRAQDEALQQSLVIRVMRTWVESDRVSAIKYATANAADGIYGATTAGIVANFVAQSDLNAGMQFAQSLPAGMAHDLAVRDVAMIITAKQGGVAANAWLESQK